MCQPPKPLCIPQRRSRSVLSSVARRGPERATDPGQTLSLSSSPVLAMKFVVALVATAAAASARTLQARCTRSDSAGRSSHTLLPGNRSRRWWPSTKSGRRRTPSASARNADSRCACSVALDPRCSCRSSPGSPPLLSGLLPPNTHLPVTFRTTRLATLRGCPTTSLCNSTTLCVLPCTPHFSAL